MVLRGIDLHDIRAPEEKSTSWKRPPLASNTFWSRLARYGSFWQEFLFSDPFICEDPTDEYWIPRRALGKGSYGHVGLWELKSVEDAEVLDRMAIKQRSMSDNLEDYDGPWRRYLAYEAVVQSQLSSMPGSENITRLRKYKYFGPADATSATVRLYMEYAKHGTLGDLLDRYRAWDLHFSELFLWHTFLSLARAIDLMRRCPRHWQPTAINIPDDDRKDDPSAEDFIVHMDFKTANVALGKRKRFEFKIDRHGEGGPDEPDSSVSDWEDQPDSDEVDDNEDRLGSEGELLGSEDELLGSEGELLGSDGDLGSDHELAQPSSQGVRRRQHQAQPPLQEKTEDSDEDQELRRNANHQEHHIEYQADNEDAQEHDESFYNIEGDEEYEDDDGYQNVEGVEGRHEEVGQSSSNADDEIPEDDASNAMKPITARDSHGNGVVQHNNVDQAPNDEQDSDMLTATEDTHSSTSKYTDDVSPPSLDSLPEDRPEDFETSDEEGEHPDRFLKYPTIKIIDFGSSRRTGPGDDENPLQFDEGVGTYFWRSPEQRRWGISENPPPHRYQSANFQIDEKANVWSVGKIMHDMMTLSRAGDVDEKLEGMVATGVWQQTYRQLVGPPGNQHPLRHFTERLTTNKRDEYTRTLRNLIWRCVRPCRSFRPTSSRLVPLVKAGLKRYLNRIGVERRLRRGRFRRAQDLNGVLLSVEDFNKIKKRGEANRQVDPQDSEDGEEWLQVIDRPCADFDEPMPQPPRDKWRHFYADRLLAPENYKLPDVQGQNWGNAGRKVVFNKDRKKKRVVSWDAQTQPDTAFRDKLNLMRAGLQGVADNKPMALLEYVLNHEKGDEDAAIEVVRWMYGDLRNARWRWLQDQIIKTRADVVKKICPKRTRKECLYFVANAGQGVERVDQAVGDLSAVFG